MKKVIVIPARYGSTRLPGKSLKEISGKPIIRWVYEKACESALKDHVIIATDDKRIWDAAKSFGAEVVMTSPDCASGTDRVSEAIHGREADVIVNLQGDEPFMRADMIDMLFHEMEKERLHMATLCSPIEDKAEYENPNIVKVVLDRFGFALYFSRSPIPYLKGFPITNYQFPISNFSVYKHIGIYAYSREFLEQYVAMERGVLEEAESLEQLRVLENGYDIKVLVTGYSGFGIDTEDDLKRAESTLGGVGG